ncbi:MAG: putative manganese transporter [Prevotellaceae bacterium]|jgi:hypothetical protein|nr:putative manganese transporter [Prevotellaceae bacterium]
MMEIVIDALRDSLLITGLVIVMLLFIEYINVYSQGRSFAKLQNRPLHQIVVGALLGLIPGCMGGFAAVSLYSHGIVSFGALIAMMVSTMGDEAFVLLASAPLTALLLMVILFSLALLVGWLTDRLLKSKPALYASSEHYALHHDESCINGTHSAIWGSKWNHIKKIGITRAILLLGLLAFIVALSFGLLEHEDHEEVTFFSERWLNLLFVVLAIGTWMLTLFANEHFIVEHLWNHIIKKHLYKIFLWTFGALLFIAIGMPFLHIDVWVAQNGYVVLLLAALIGLIPQSGPHLVFIALFVTGSAPFSILFTNFFIQDGHTALPLLADSRSAFVKAKAIKLVVGIAIGSLLFLNGM